MSSTASPPPYIVPPCEQQVELLYADEELLLVNKPSGLLSVPGKHPANRDCLILRVQMDFPEARIVHRLDMDTSGIMVLALNADSHRALSRSFAERQVHKQYLAEVFGSPELDTGEIELPVICDWPNRPKQMVDHEHGKYALTRFEVLSRNAERNTSRLQLTPITGRSHQLRIHLAEISHPILGCDFYAHEQARTMATRLQLHASALSFPHPRNCKSISWQCDSPF